MHYRQHRHTLRNSIVINRDKLFRACLLLFKKAFQPSMIIAAAAIMVTIAIASPTPVNAVTKTATQNPGEQAQSFAYFKALRTCMETGFYKNSIDSYRSMSQQNAIDFDWFFSRQVTGVANGINVGAFNDPRGKDGDGRQNCGDSEGKAWIAKAAALWGYTNGPTLLCALGFSRENSNGTSCSDTTPGVDNDFYKPSGSNGAKMDALWRDTLGNSSLGVNSITPTGGAYRIYLDNFMSQCRPSELGTTYTIEIYDQATKQWSTKKYGATDRDRNTEYKVTVWEQQTMTCAELAAAVSKKDSPAVLGYQKWLENNVGGEDTGTPGGGELCTRDPTTAGCVPPEDQPTCGSMVAGVGWIICPVIAGLSGLNDAMWGIASTLLTVDPLDDDGPIFAAWSTIRSVANVLFVIVFLIIIFSQLTSTGISNYGVKKMLPRLVIGAILVNASFIIVSLAVDLANVTGNGLYELLKGMAPEFNPAAQGWAALSNLITGAVAVGGLTIAGVAIAGGAAAVFWLILPMAALGALGLLAAVITLIFRQAIIPVLAILAPLAFIAYLLPNTESWYKKWQGLLLSMLMLFPIAAILFGGVRFVSGVIIGDGQDWWKLLIGLIMLTLPLFSLPFLARQSGPIAGKLGSALGGLTGRLKKPINGLAGNRGALAKARYENNPIRRNSKGKVLLRDKARAARQKYSRNSRMRDIQTAAWGAESNAAFNQEVVDNTENLTQGLAEGGAGAAYINAVTARAQSDDIKLVMDSMKLEAGFNPNDREKLAEKLAEAIKGGDSRRATALTNHLVAARGVDELHSTLENAQKKGEMSGTMQTAMQRAMTSSENGGVIKERRPDLTKWGASGDKKLADVTSNPGTWAMSAEDAAGLSIGALRSKGAQAGLPSDIANRVLTTPNLQGKLDPDKEREMLQIRDRDGVSGAPAPIQPSPLVMRGDADWTPNPSTITPPNPTNPPSSDKPADYFPIPKK